MAAPGETPSGADRRQCVRIATEGTAKYRLMRGDLKQLTGRLFNVSTGGACVEGSVEVRPGDVLRLEFSVPGVEGGITALVEVAWLSGADAGRRMGVRYLAIRPDEADRVRSFVETKTTDA